MENQAQQPAAPQATATPMPTPSQPAPQQPAAPSAPAAPQAASGSSAPAPKKSSKMMLVFVILTLVVLSLAGWFAYSYFINKSTQSMYQGTQVQQPLPSATPSPTTGPVKSGDAKLDQQSSAIDESMQKAENDVKGVDTGLNDQSVNLN